MGFTGTLPERVLSRIAPEDRKPLGKVGVAAAEAQAKYAAGKEDELQSDIRQYLRLHAIEFINPSMRRKSALPKGWPDFCFSYRGTPVCIEAKTEAGQLEPDQAALHPKLIANGWRVVVARSLADVQAVFREIDAILFAREKLLC